MRRAAAAFGGDCCALAGEGVADRKNIPGENSNRRGLHGAETGSWRRLLFVRGKQAGTRGGSFLMRAFSSPPYKPARAGGRSPEGGMGGLSRGGKKASAAVPRTWKRGNLGARIFLRGGLAGTRW